MVDIGIRFFLIKLYKNIFVKKLKIIELNEKCNVYDSLHHIERTEKKEAYKQMDKSAYVLLFLLIYLKNCLEGCNKFHLFWKLLSKRGRESLYHFAVGGWKGGEIMQASSFEKAIEAQFDCLVKKVIKCEQKKYCRDMYKHQKKEITFSDLPEQFYSKISVVDDYLSDCTIFNVLGMEVHILDEQLSKVLKILPEKKRNIILLSYFMDMSDSEIGQLMNLVRSTIYRHRTSTLEEIKRMYQEECGNEE